MPGTRKSHRPLNETPPQGLSCGGVRLGIKVSGLHCLRSNYAQEKYRKLRKQGKPDMQARLAVSQALGHNRVDVMGCYVDVKQVI